MDNIISFIVVMFIISIVGRIAGAFKKHAGKIITSDPLVKPGAPGAQQEPLNQTKTTTSTVTWSSKNAKTAQRNSAPGSFNNKPFIPSRPTIAIEDDDAPFFTNPEDEPQDTTHAASDGILFNADDLARSVVMAEILRRPRGQRYKKTA